MIFIFTITERRKKLLEILNIYSYKDLLNYFPYKYVDYDLSNLDSTCNGKRVVIRGKILEKSRIIFVKSNLMKYTFSVIYNDIICKITVYNRDYLYDKLIIGNEVIVAGKYKYKQHNISAYDIFYDDLDKITIKPVYHLCDNLYENELRKMIFIAFKEIDSSFFNEDIPSNFISKYKLMDKKHAFYYAHFPKNKEKLKQALRYLKYSELLKYSINMSLNHNKMRKLKVNKRYIDRNNLNYILSSNKITLTNDQIKVCKEIFTDIESNKTMYRLLIGDVGCGKTIVASLALASICKNNYQGVLLCPTDILARQHYSFISNFLKDYKIELLVSNLKNKDIIKEKIRKNDVNIVIGTTSLIEDDVVFNNLGIVVIDEQHRFGVKQRQKLIEKGQNVDVLYMSATPIPRSLALSIYGELDISFIREFPNKKRDVISKVINTNSVNKIQKIIDKHLKNKEKIFIVCPLIEGESDKRSAISIYNELTHFYSNEVQIIHGKIKDDDKNIIIEKFKNNEFHILVSTTVIEVGIDIKDASVMIIFNANCYGLATLHQLRGRIGRDGNKAYCYFLCHDKNEMDRLNFLKNNDDGFKISEYDLHRRGPGELEGVKQSGIREFVFVDLENDGNILEITHQDAQIIINNCKNSEEYRNYVTKL